MGLQRVRHNWAISLLLFTSCIGEENDNPLQCSCLENPRGGGASWAAIYGVAKSQTQLKQLSISSSSRPCLGISELKWTEMGKFNWDDYYIYYCGQESHRKNGIVPIINKRVWKFEMQYLGATSKMTGWSQVVSKASHSASQLFKSIFHKNL